MNILLIEPNNLLADVYKKSLERAGHAVAVGRDAQNAVLVADGNTPDIVVLELQLPGHSGVEFLYEFRSYPEWQDIPVILHTMVPEQEFSLPAQLNVAGHLYKPVTSLKQLVRAVNELATAGV